MRLNTFKYAYCPFGYIEMTSSTSLPTLPFDCVLGPIYMPLQLTHSFKPLTLGPLATLLTEQLKLPMLLPPFLNHRLPRVPSE